MKNENKPMEHEHTYINEDFSPDEYAKEMSAINKKYVKRVLMIERSAYDKVVETLKQYANENNYDAGVLFFGGPGSSPDEGYQARVTLEEVGELD